jgi:hypothetical protein
MRDAFVCWMESLDPVAVARTNSFYSMAHVLAMREHDAQVRLRKCQTFWANELLMREYVFTDEQIEIAIRALDNQAKLSSTGLDLNGEV